MNPFEVLCVQEDITHDELRKTFLRLAKELHPDTAETESEKMDKERKFKEITHAYSILKNTVTNSNKRSEVSQSKDLLIKKARSYISKGDYNSAMEALRVIDEDDSYEINMLFGIIFLEKGKFHEAIKRFKRTMQINPWSADSYAYIGEVYESIYLKKTAEKYYEEALNINPENKKALEGLNRLSPSFSFGSFLNKVLKGKG